MLYDINITWYLVCIGFAWLYTVQHKVISTSLNVTVLTRKTWDSSNSDYLFPTTKLYFIKYEGVDLTELRQYLSVLYYQSISTGLCMCYSQDNLHELTTNVIIGERLRFWLLPRLRPSSRRQQHRTNRPSSSQQLLSQGFVPMFMWNLDSLGRV